MLSDGFPFEEFYNYNVSQELAGNNEEIGGEGFKVYPSVRSGFMADAGLDKSVSLGDSVQLIAEDIGEPAEYNWYLNGELIDQGLDIFVTPSVNQEYTLEVIREDDMMKDYDRVNVTIKESEILLISPNPSHDFITIEYEINQVINQNAKILILLPFGGSHEYIIDPLSNNILINVTSLNTGVYNVSMVCDGVVKDYDSFIKN